MAMPLQLLQLLLVVLQVSIQLLHLPGALLKLTAQLLDLSSVLALLRYAQTQSLHGKGVVRLSAAWQLGL